MRKKLVLYSITTVLLMSTALNAATLLSASESGDLQQVENFLENGADVNMKNSEGKTPLQLAIDEDHTGVMKLLLNSGADITPPYEQ